MDQTKADDVHEENPLPQLGKKLPQAAQLMVVGFAGALFVAAFVAMPALVNAISPPEAAKAEAPSQVENGTFKATDKQWPTLKIQPVQSMEFQDSAETDGRIALDDDLTTPVFSPY